MNQELSIQASNILQQRHGYRYVNEYVNDPQYHNPDYPDYESILLADNPVDAKKALLDKHSEKDFKNAKLLSYVIPQNAEMLIDLGPYGQLFRYPAEQTLQFEEQ